MLSDGPLTLKIVTGMHRSGTSLVARLLFESGADLGDSRLFFRPDKWNPDGYFEQPDFHAINMPLINGRVGKLAYFKLPKTETIIRRSQRFADRIRQVAAKYDHCVVKETRFCLTLPAWLRHGTNVSKLLVCLRSPRRVAESLRKRNKIPIWFGEHLWRVHNERLFENTRGLDVHVLIYERVTDAQTYLDELSRAFQFMQMPLEPARLKALCADKIRFTASDEAREPLVEKRLAGNLWERWMQYR